MNIFPYRPALMQGEISQITCFCTQPKPIKRILKVKENANYYAQRLANKTNGATECVPSLFVKDFMIKSLRRINKLSITTGFDMFGT